MKLLVIRTDTRFVRNHLDLLFDFMDRLQINGFMMFTYEQLKRGFHELFGNDLQNKISWNFIIIH